MMADNHITVLGNGFVNDFFRDIQANQCLVDFGIEVAYLHTGIIITLLPLQRSNLSNTV